MISAAMLASIRNIELNVERLYLHVDRLHVGDTEMYSWSYPYDSKIYLIQNMAMKIEDSRDMVSLSLSLSLSLSFSLYIYIYTYVYTYAYIFIYIYVIYMYIYIYIYICIYI